MTLPGLHREFKASLGYIKHAPKIPSVYFGNKSHIYISLLDSKQIKPILINCGVSDTMWCSECTFMPVCVLPALEQNYNAKKIKRLH